MITAHDGANNLIKETKKIGTKKNSQNNLKNQKIFGNLSVICSNRHSMIEKKPHHLNFPADRYRVERLC